MVTPARRGAALSVKGASVALAPHPQDHGTEPRDALQRELLSTFPPGLTTVSTAGRAPLGHVESIPPWTALRSTPRTSWVALSLGSESQTPG